MYKIKPLLFLSVVLFTFGTNRAVAQTDTLKITFQDAEKQFLENNLSLLAQKYNVEASKALIQQAKLWDNPVLSTDQNIHTSGSNKFFDHSKGQGQVFVQLNQVFTTAGKRGKQVQMAKDDAMVQEAAFNDLMRNLRYNLRLDFSQLATLNAQQKVYENEITSATNLVKAIQKSYDAGNTSMKDLIRLKALLFGLQNDMVENNRQINDLQTELKTLLQTKETAFVDPIINDKPTENVTLDVPSLIEQAKASRPDYLSNQYQLNSATHNLAYQRALAVPDITIGASYDKNSNYAPNYYGLEIGLPLPFFNRNQGNIKSAKYNIKSQESTLKQSEFQLKNEVVAAVNQYKLNQQLFTTQQVEFNEQYDKLFSSMLKSFQQRQISLIEFVDFFDTYKDTKLKILQQQYNLQKSIADLNFAIGIPVIKS
ncbi:TolC family protein [Mucilaginibacter lappiensis]|uniref:Cobalt-zinc-cadmium efflux system outer membrane protein n=1 Tax=Mucilaginibacter lappiensis TaxID=354630 RepID=A0A1N6Q5P9_9SPHI|nr:TolC family protein [Mucilaginibacter lappiensis]MBB6107335.1 cobalt-zinc-cadmium efflux system outer membrane protein [Mucilaginibacter lappiensis]MBB6126390.1 cobalt-zinc-cadmium efflux system outer membrane protein [Mucilaginibacter lappiensis]SIQ11911.1 outer membrane protein, cobalt-zinc-cadmium efflux system [Mucilaginibacter lappiensis]